MEIRPIRAGEAETFLRLLCDVFTLDFGRAHRIFFTEPMFDLNRKWALIEDSEILSILTTVGLEFGWGKAIGIAGVATREDRQRQGLASHLLDAVLKQADADGEPGALLFAREPALYAKAGFEIMDEVIRGPIEVVPEKGPFEIWDYEQVQEHYNHWALQDPNRLHRDDRRWGYWRWNLRVCSQFGDGYICSEAGTVREVVASEPVKEWPLPAGAEWFGLASVAKQIGIPLKTQESSLHLMARHVPGCPQMFMTDQF